jgi:hypothetical protein
MRWTKLPQGCHLRSFLACLGGAGELSTDDVNFLNHVSAGVLFHGQCESPIQCELVSLLVRFPTDNVDS